MDATPAEFFRVPVNGTHGYLTCPLQRLAPHLASSAVDQSHFALSEDPSSEPVLEYEGGPLMRLSSIGSVCQCHWDAKHNVFVQLHGRKRFYLWLTTALPSLRLHSSKHALYPKSMINMDAPSPERFGSEPLATLASAVSVDLEPGDVLYLPPMVPHHVECLGEGPDDAPGWCVGFNVFSTGNFSAVFGDVQRQVHNAPLGWFARDWPQSPVFVLPMLQYVLRDLVDGLGLELHDVAKQVRTQWDPLRHEGAEVGTSESAAGRYLRGSAPLCSSRDKRDDDEVHPALIM